MMDYPLDAPRTLREHLRRRDGTPIPLGRDELFYRVWNERLPASVVAALVVEFAELPEPYAAWVRAVALGAEPTCPPDPPVTTWPRSITSWSTVSDVDLMGVYHRARSICTGLASLHTRDFAAQRVAYAIPNTLSGDTLRASLTRLLSTWTTCPECRGTSWTRSGSLDFPCHCERGLVPLAQPLEAA